jgi:hypothetical protein
MKRWDTGTGIKKRVALRDFVVFDRASPCVICGVATYWAELNFEAPLHPAICERALWLDYWRAVQELPPPEPWPEEDQ